MLASWYRVFLIADYPKRSVIWFSSTTFVLQGTYSTLYLDANFIFPKLNSESDFCKVFYMDPKLGIGLTGEVSKGRKEEGR